MAERIYVVMYDVPQDDGTVATKVDLAFRDYAEAYRRKEQVKGAWLDQTLYIDEVVDYYREEQS